MKPETRVKYVAKHIAPLADWLVKFKPSCGVISIPRADWEFLRTQAEYARTQGFVIQEDQVRYSNFELRPIDNGARLAGPSASP